MPQPTPPAVRRELILDVPLERLWRALTDPEEVGVWLGASVCWELVAGGPAHFVGGDGADRVGRVLEVVPAQRLRFAWWPEDGDEGDASVVGYDLRPGPDGQGTRLVVTEEAAAPVARGAADAHAVDWSTWDSRLLSLWASTAARALAAVSRR